MKTLKYFAAFLAAALMFSACEQPDELNQQNKGKEKPTVTLTQKVANDVTLTFDIAASANASQYAYAVFVGSDNAVPSAYDIVVEETLAKASGSFNTAIAEDDAYTNTVTIDCANFPAKTYQVFAAAITETGLLGEVVTLDVTMNDTEIPQPAGAEVDGNTVTLAFSEAVKRGTGKAYYYVIAWATEDLVVDAGVIAEENIIVEANTVTIVCPEAGDGAGYIVSFEEGLVTDLSGNPCEECESGLDENYDYVGIGWDTDNVDIPITASCFEEPAEDTDWLAEGASLVFTLPTEVMVNTTVKNPVCVLYKEAEGESKLYAEWTLGEDNKTVTVVLPKAPTGEFDVCVAAELFYDMWGNFTTAFEPEGYRYSNFLIDIVEGQYLVDYLYSGENGEAVLGQFPLYFELLDKTTAVIYPDWFNYVANEYGQEGYVCMPYLVGSINYAKQTITFDGIFMDDDGATYSGAFSQAYYYYDSAKTQFLVFWGGGETGKDPVTMTFGEDGYLATMSYCDYSIHKTSGAFLGVYGCTAVTDEADATVTYVPEEEEETSVANAPNNFKLERANVKGIFRK